MSTNSGRLNSICEHYFLIIISDVSPSLSSYLGKRLKTVLQMLSDSIIVAFIYALSFIPNISVNSIKGNC